jgi:hypothetical protein
MSLVRFQQYKGLLNVESELPENFSISYGHPIGAIIKDTLALRAESYAFYSGTTGVKHMDKNSISVASTSLDDVNDNSAYYGPVALSRFRPRKPVIGLGQALAEVRELPRMFKDAYDLLSDIKNIDSLDGLYEFLSDTSHTGPSSYVALQFGWKPFIKDVTDGLHLRENLHRSWNRAVQNHDKSVRRRGVVDATTSENSVVQTKSTSGLKYRIAHMSQAPNYNGAGYQYAIDSSFLLFNGNKFIVSAEYDHKVWFSARFRTFFPPLQRSYIQSFREIGAYLDFLGLSITPKLLYDLLPWSWLVDWTSNLGSIIDNYSSDDSIVTEYAYIMEHTRTRYSTKVPLIGSRYYRSDGSYTLQNQGAVLKSELVCENKLRREASPYGFALDPGSFTARQWSILGSLGMIKNLKPSYNP